MVRPLLVIGSINYDTICTVDRFPRSHEKVRGAAIATCLGGSAANTAAWLTWSGYPVRLIGTVGSDAEGRACVAMAQAAGIECAEIATDPRAATGRAVCLSTRRGKRIVTSPGPGLGPALAMLERDRKSSRESLVHVAAPETSELIAACRKARRAGAEVSVELNGRKMDGIRELATIAFLNHDELRDGFDIAWRELDVSSLARLLPTPAAKLVVTLGRDGALCVEQSGITRVRAQSIRIVERTGGGDAFNAGFLAGHAGRLSVAESLKNGTKFAAQALSKIGGQPR